VEAVVALYDIGELTSITLRRCRPDGARNRKCAAGRSERLPSPGRRRVGLRDRPPHNNTARVVLVGRTGFLADEEIVPATPSSTAVQKTARLVLAATTLDQLYACTRCIQHRAHATDRGERSRA
jgi:hypothetical protein